MKVGIVGKPNVGKSSFFKSLTLADAQTGNFPFTTIEANRGIAFLKVADPAQDFNKTSDPRDGYIRDTFRFIPTEVVDVAGLVPGAHEGKGLGNKFLDDLRQADILIHVIDASGSTNEKGESVPLQSYDPLCDINFLEHELDHWYLSILKRNFDAIKKKVTLQHYDMMESITDILSGLKITIGDVEDVCRKLDITTISVLEERALEFCTALRTQTKPILIAANKIDKVLDQAPQIIQRLQEATHLHVIPVMAEYELNLKLADKYEFIKYIPGEQSFSFTEKTLTPQQQEGLITIEKALTHYKTGVQEALNYAVFNLLSYFPVYPGGVSKLEDSKGNVLPDAFLLPPNSTALDFAFKLHTDFGKHFIKAINVRTKMSINKDTSLSFGDIIEIISGK